MAPRPIALLFGLGLAIGIFGALWFRVESPPPDLAPEKASTPAVKEAIPPTPRYDPADPQAREDAIRLPSEVAYPIEAKYRETPLSEVPHELIAAYEASRGRRVFILSVPPETARERLEQLVEDLRTRNLDAKALNIQIFDSKLAATHPLKAGVSVDPQRVAAYSRHGASVTYELQGKPAPTP